MKNPKRLVIALADRWVEQFVGAEQMLRLEQSFDDCLRLSPESFASADDWRRELLKLEPCAMLTGWGTPMIPCQALPKLKIVGHTAGSVRGIVKRCMIEKGLAVVNWGDAAAPAVAECALLLVLGCLRQLNHWSNVMHGERGWKTKDNGNAISLFGKRVGIHGFGRIARQFVKLLAPFDCKVTAFSAGVPAEEFAAEGVAQAASLEDLFSNCDVLVEVEALNELTRRSVTASLLRLLPPGGAFVNVGRGATVDEIALERIAMEGNLQIGLDVYATEPLPAHSPLRGLKNVILMPHLGGPTRDQRRTCGLRAVNALCGYAASGAVEQSITAAEFDRST